MCQKKERIIAALKQSGMEEDQAIATELEIGKISMVGCTTYRDETNKHLMETLLHYHHGEPEEARRLAKKLSEMLRIEKNAIAASDAVAQRFYTRMFQLRRSESVQGTPHRVRR